jgi:hypothetical protein
MGGVNMQINITNLQIGLSRWKARPGWESDLHAKFYQLLSDKRRFPIDDNYLNFLIDTLARWKALRPRTKEYIRGRILPRLDRLSEEAEELFYYSQSINFNFDSYRWDDIRNLFYTSQEIKEGTSSVFASKLCHFLIPWAFPVNDNVYTGITKSYPDYWLTCHKEWVSATNRDELVAFLKNQIQDQNNTNYPWGAKISEICASASKR